MTCLFSHFSLEEKIPNYVLYYLEHLKRKVDKVILLTNIRTIENINIVTDMGIEYHMYPNSGYDFGMYYKFLMNNSIECDELFLVNDSMILFNSLDSIMEWKDNNKEAELLGITDSIEVSHHLQSYFLILRKSAQALFKSYLEKNLIMDNFRDVILVYEVGFSTEVIMNNLLIAIMFQNKEYTTPDRTNSVIYYPDKLIENGMPMIKKKVLFNTFSTSERDFLKTMNYDFNKDRGVLIDKFKEPSLNKNYLITT